MLPRPWDTRAGWVSRRGILPARKWAIACPAWRPRIRSGTGASTWPFPFYADSRLVSEIRPLPKTEKLTLDVPLDVVDVPRILLKDHVGHGQPESHYEVMPHLHRYMLRAFRNHPLGMLRFVVNNARLEWAARRRSGQG